MDTDRQMFFKTDPMTLDMAKKVNIIHKFTQLQWLNHSN